MSFKLVSKKCATYRRTVKCNLLQYARENRDEGIFNDVTIVTDNETIVANRLVLACYSKYFELMLKSNKASLSQVVDAQKASGKAVKSIIDYFYTEAIEIKCETVIDLLKASDYLQVDDVKEFCFSYLKSTISFENLITTLNIASTYGSNTLREDICQYVKTHLKGLIQTDQFKSLPKTKLFTLLSELKESKILFSTLYSALIAWIKHDISTRNEEFEEFFQLLFDRSQVSCEFIENKLLHDNFIANSGHCHQLVLNAFSKLLKSKSARLIECRHSKIISVGGLCTRQKVYKVFDLHDRDLESYPNLPEKMDLALFAP